MLGYALKRFLGALPTLFIIVTVAFFMMRAAPGGPFDSARKLPPEIEHNIEAAYNLDKPVYEQYFIYLGRLAHFDLGPSYKNKDFTVTQLIEDGLPVSAKLGLSEAEKAELAELNRQTDPPVRMVMTLDGKQILTEVVEGNIDFAYAHGNRLCA